jgi:hypothetical protein
MADMSGRKESCSPSLLNYPKSVATQNCEKCAELELELQIMRDELNSVHLIIQMLNTEQIQKDPIASQTQHAEAEQRGDESWNTVKNKGIKRRSEGNMNLNNSQLHNIKEAALATNCFTPLITNRNVTINEDKMKFACEIVPHANNSGWKQVVKNPKSVCSTTGIQQERLILYIQKRNITSKPTARPYNIHTQQKKRATPYRL